MGKQQPDMIRGTLDMLVLKVLSVEPINGWGICERIQLISDDELQVNQGSLYPALQRMQVKGYIKAEWGLSENKRRARFYRLSPKGQEQLDREVESFDRVMEAIAHVMLPG